MFIIDKNFRFKNAISPHTTRYNIMIVLLGSVLFSVPWMTFAETTNCSAVFTNGAQTHHNADGFVRFDYNARITNPSSLSLDTPRVEQNNWSMNNACCRRPFYAKGTQVEILLPENKLQTESQVEVIVPPKTHILLGDDENNEFGLIRVSASASATFSAKYKLYVLDRVQVDYKGAIRLTAGEYWIRDLQLEPGSRIDVVGEGTVNLHVLNPLSTQFKATLNGNTKDPAKLSIYAADSVDFGVASKTFAFVIAEGTINLHHGAQLTGGIVAQSAHLHSESEVLFDIAGARLVDFGKLCQAELPSNPDTTRPQLSNINFGYASENPPNLRQFTVTGLAEDVGVNPSGVATVEVIVNGDIYIAELTNNKFFVEVLLDYGNNSIKIIATDLAGNVATAPIWLETPHRARIENVTPANDTVFNTPEISIAGNIVIDREIEEIIFEVNHRRSFNLSGVAPNAVRFEQSYTLKEGLNNILLTVTASAWDYGEYHMIIYYTPP